MSRIPAVLTLIVLAGCATSPDYTAESVIQAQRTQPATTATSPATPVTGEIAPSLPTPAPPVEQSYAGESIQHWVHGVLDRGAQIKLEDGSVWEISPNDRSRTMLWLVLEKISVNRSPNPRYPFRVTNLRHNITVDARLLSTGEPR